MTQNDRQVGGSHYNKVAIQHWDLVAIYEIRYFDSAILKYVARHRKKNKTQDLDKAIHFCDKLIELTTVGIPVTSTAGVSYQLILPFCSTYGGKFDLELPDLAMLERYIQANGLNSLEAEISTRVLTYRSLAELQAIREKLVELQGCPGGYHTYDCKADEQQCDAACRRTHVCILCGAVRGPDKD